MEGKTNTATAIAVDQVFSKIHTIVSPDGTEFPVLPYKLDQVKLLPLPNASKDEEPKIITIPDDYSIKTDTKIFANYHLFGIPYVLCGLEVMMEYLNSNLISHGLMIIDEAYISGDARRGMSSLTLILTWFGQQMRKRDIELYLLVQHGRFIDWRFRYIAKRKILCRYNEKTQKIRLLIQNLGKGTEKLMSYDAPLYWKYFDTNELPAIPDKMLVGGKKWT